MLYLYRVSTEPNLKYYNDARNAEFDKAIYFTDTVKHALNWAKLLYKKTDIEKVNVYRYKIKDDTLTVKVKNDGYFYEDDSAIEATLKDALYLLNDNDNFAEIIITDIELEDIEKYIDPNPDIVYVFFPAFLNEIEDRAYNMRKYSPNLNIILDEINYYSTIDNLAFKDMLKHMLRYKKEMGKKYEIKIRKNIIRDDKYDAVYKIKYLGDVVIEAELKINTTQDIIKFKTKNNKLVEKIMI